MKKTILFILFLFLLTLAGCDGICIGPICDGVVGHDDIGLPSDDDNGEDGGSGSGGGSGGGSGSGSGTGGVTPQTITLTATASVSEGNSGTKSQTITATQSATSTINTTVNLITSGTASDNGTDYTLDNSTILITAGSTTGTTSVTIIGDRIQESDETIVVDIDTVTGGDNATESGSQQETITITNDDIAGFSLTISTNNTVTESGAGDTFGIELDTEPAADVTVTITDNDSSEILVSPTSLVFSSGNYSTAQTVNLTAVEDDVIDDNQTVRLTLIGSSTDSFYNVVAMLTSVTVVDSGNVAPLVSFSTPTFGPFTEGDSGYQDVTVDVVQSRTAASDTTVTFSTTSAPADSASNSGVANYTKDYAWVSSNFIISAGNTTGSGTIRLYGDELDEDNESIYINMSVSGGGSENGSQTATVQIIDDDTAPILDNVTAGIGQITANWSAFDNATGYKLYYDTNANVSTSDSYFSLASNTTSYIHSGRIPSTTYYYRLVATTAGGDSIMSLEKSTAATAFPGCDELGYRSDNDTDLVAHFPFQNNGEDVLDTNGDGRYDMTNLQGTMQYTPGCATGQSLYIDSTSGVMRNDNFTDTNLGGNIASGNFTISFWTVRDGDMTKFSSAVNTGLKGAHAPTGSWSTKTQFDVGSGGSLRWMSQYATMGSNINLTENEWYYVAGTVDSSGKGTLYVNGKQEATSASFQGNFKALMVGVNRSADYSTRYWKGYVDELKVYKKTMTVDEIIEKCFFESNNCSYVLTTAPTLTATPRSTAIDLSWNQLVGSDNVTIYWRTSGGAFESPPTAPTASDNVINLADNQTNYSLTGLTNGDYYHFVILANNRNGSSSISSVTGNVQPN